MDTPQDISPTDYSRRSPLYRWHRAAGADFSEFADSAIVAAYTEPGAEARQAERLGLADLSSLPRVGFKGAGATAWLESRGMAVPREPNTSHTASTGAVCARLSAQELLVLNDLQGRSDSPHSLEQAWAGHTAVNTWLVPRRDSHCWFALSGQHAAEALSKLCAVDVRAHTFASTAIAQTSVARSSAIVLRQDLGATHNFYLLADISITEYLWEVLLDAIAEYGGLAVGVDALRQLTTTP